MTPVPAGTPPPYQPGQVAPDGPGWFQAPPPRRTDWHRIGTLVGVPLFMAACGIAVLVWVGYRIGVTPLIVGLVSAIIPVPVLAFCFLWLDRYEPAPIRHLALCLGWGASVATGGALLAEWGESRLFDHYHLSGDLLPVIGAPVAEEVMKSLGPVLLLVLTRRRAFSGMVDGIVYCGLSATGFAMIENILYLGGYGYSHGVEQGGTTASGVAGLIGVFIGRIVLSGFAHPLFTAMTGIGLGLAARASGRWMRWLAPAAGLLTAMILKICGGEASEVVRAGSPPNDPVVVDYDPGLAERLGGIAISEEEQRRTLDALEFRVSPDWRVTAPLRRHDIEGPADIVEEVVRIHGLDGIESVSLPRTDGVARPTATPEQATERRVRRAAAARGLNEAITWSFISEKEAEVLGGGAWVLENPISEELKVMRASLLPGLLSAVRRNLDRGASSVRLFEIGRRYLAEGEHPTLVCVLAGERTPRSWQGGKAQAFDAFDAKAICLELLEASGAPVDKLQVMGEAGAVYHPGQSATLRLGPKNALASFGMIHPNTLKAFEIDVPVAALGIHFDAIPAKKGGGSFARPAYSPPALQAVKRDFAFLVDAALPAGDLLRATRGADKANIVDARIFDDFRGQGVPEGRKSLAIEVTLQPGEKSYTDEDLKAISERVVAAAAKLGAELRG